MSIKIQLYKSKKNADSSHPVVVRFNERGERFLITLPFNAKESEWNGQCYRGIKPEIKEKNKRLAYYNSRAIRTVRHFEEKFFDFSDRELFKKFFWDYDYEEKRFRDEETNREHISVYEFIESLIDRLDKEERYNRKDDMVTLKNRLFGSKRLKPFCDKSMLFSDMKVKFLKDFIAHLYADGVKGGIRNYMKDLRAVYIAARDEEVFEEEKKSPFLKIDFGSFKKEHNPRPLSLEDLKAFIRIPISEHLDLEESYYSFLFLYYSAGTRFKDGCLLTYDDNVIDNKITYTAGKTKKLMPTVIVDENLSFIMKKLNRGTGYVLPYLNSFHKTEKQKHYRVNKCIKKFNNDLRKLAKIANIKGNITSYVARHSVGNILLEMGATLREVQSVYNHQRADTTRHYVKRLGHNQISRVHELLKVNLEG